MAERTRHNEDTHAVREKRPPAPPQFLSSTALLALRPNATSCRLPRLLSGLAAPSTSQLAARRCLSAHLHALQVRPLHCAATALLPSPTRVPGFLSFGLAPSAMARMPGLLVAFLGAAIAVISMMPRGRDACWRASVAEDLPCDTNSDQENHALMLPSPSLAHLNDTATSQNATCGSPTHAHSVATSSHPAATLNMPPQCRQVLVRVGITQASAQPCLLTPSLFMLSLFSVHLRIPLPSRRLLSSPLIPPSLPCRRMLQSREASPLLHSLMAHIASGMMGVGEAVATAIVGMAGTLEWKEAMELKMSMLGGQMEETRRELASTKGELEEAERRRVAEMRTMKEHQDAVMQLRVEEAIGKCDGDEKKAWQLTALTQLICLGLPEGGQVFSVDLRKRIGM
ncbi:unnamed protein product [Closterium sp. NIES-64]|nr:unnamed protein product [Closterium sp. NIES-64]